MKEIRAGFSQRKLLLKFDNFEGLELDVRRKLLRDQILEEFITEAPGVGKGEDSSRWIYSVEEACLNSIIYIQRPAALNKGMDFTVNITKPVLFYGPTEKNRKRTTNTPRHDSLYFPIEYLRENKKPNYDLLLCLLKDIYLCLDTTDFEQKNFQYLSEIFEYSPINEVKLKINCLTIARTIKWLFLEQDMTYWNWSGRRMYWNALSDRFGELNINNI